MIHFNQHMCSLANVSTVSLVQKVARFYLRHISLTLDETFKYLGEASAGGMSSSTSGSGLFSGS